MMKFVCGTFVLSALLFSYLTPIAFQQDALSADYNYNSPNLDEDRESRARTERLALLQLDKAKVRRCLYTLA